jgi:monothiol glutaredoxin
LSLSLEENTFWEKIMSTDVNARIDELVKNNKVLVFMKGNKLMPQCGFSNTVVQILNNLGVPYETVDVLSDPAIRQGIKDYSNWQTIPQVYINGEFIGGCDITIELYQKGKLQEKLEVALAS